MSSSTIDRRNALQELIRKKAEKESRRHDNIAYLDKENLSGNSFSQMNIQEKPRFFKSKESISDCEEVTFSPKEIPNAHYSDKEFRKSMARMNLVHRSKQNYSSPTSSSNVSQSEGREMYQTPESSYGSVSSDFSFNKNSVEDDIGSINSKASVKSVSQDSHVTKNHSSKAPTRTLNTNSNTVNSINSVNSVNSKDSKNSKNSFPEYSQYSETKSTKVTAKTSQTNSNQNTVSKTESDKQDSTVTAASVSEKNKKQQPAKCVIQWENRSLHCSEQLISGLYPHQIQGLTWLWSLHVQKTGGILGDDMGLGKTRQVATFIASLFKQKLIKRILLVLPTTLLEQWRAELASMGLYNQVHEYVSSMTPNQRETSLHYIFKYGGIMLTTYDFVANHYESLKGRKHSNEYMDDEDDEDEYWNYVILDEGHIVKNPATKRYKGIKSIPYSHCIILTGTPIQNNLKEIWALFSLCNQKLLGDYKEFKFEYESKITDGSDKHASQRAMREGSRAAERLREKMKPFFLRRLKSEIFPNQNFVNNDKNDDANDCDVDSSDSNLNGQAKEITPKLPRKNDLIVWLRLSQRQRRLYKAFLNSDVVKTVLNESRSPLAAVTVLKKICDHPALLNENAVNEIMEGMEELIEKNSNSNSISSIQNNISEAMDGFLGREKNFDVLAHDLTASCKIKFLFPLLENLISEKHRILVFSQTRIMLDIIEEEIKKRKIKFSRIDGTVSLQLRGQRVEEFQNNPSIPLFLLTSQVGGLGLTLHAADRVIIIDPAWNPSVDDQSVDRAYRIGQKRDVIVYRLISAATVEEKIYRKQVHKGGLLRTATDEKIQMRYFSKRDLQDLFEIPKCGFDHSETLNQLKEEHSVQNSTNTELSRHIRFLENLDIAGISHHNLLFSKEAEPLMEAENDEREDSLKPNDSRWHQPRLINNNYYQQQNNNNNNNNNNKNKNNNIINIDIDSSNNNGWRGSSALGKILNDDTEKRKVQEERKEAMDIVFAYKSKIDRIKSMLTDRSLSLPDGGNNLRKNLEKLYIELSQAESKLQKADEKLIVLDTKPAPQLRPINLPQSSNFVDLGSPEYPQRVNVNRLGKQPESSFGESSPSEPRRKAIVVDDESGLDDVILSLSGLKVGPRKGFIDV